MTLPKKAIFTTKAHNHKAGLNTAYSWFRHINILLISEFILS